MDEKTFVSFPDCIFKDEFIHNFIYNREKILNKLWKEIIFFRRMDAERKTNGFISSGEHGKLISDLMNLGISEEVIIKVLNIGPGIMNEHVTLFCRGTFK